jgi:hypothetical protein
MKNPQRKSDMLLKTKTMKIILFSLVTLFTIASLDSCKKDYTCTCTTTTTGVAPMTYPLYGATQKQATNACNNDGAALDSSGVAVWSCSI